MTATNATGATSRIPYAGVLGGRDPELVIAETPARLERVLNRLTIEQVEARPAPGKWCVREVVAHLADCEIAWSWRLRFVLENERGEVQPFDQDAWARMYDRYPLGHARAMFEELRAWNIAFVDGLTEADKRKAYVHPERGEETLWNLVEIMAGHDLHHLQKLEEQFGKA